MLRQSCYPASLVKKLKIDQQTNEPTLPLFCEVVSLVFRDKGFRMSAALSESLTSKPSGQNR
jgi:hypothetical protein